jgi:hypothetical protein
LLGYGSESTYFLHGRGLTIAADLQTIRASPFFSVPELVFPCLIYEAKSDTGLPVVAQNEVAHGAAKALAMVQSLKVALAVTMKWGITLIDIATAYLNAETKDEVYVSRPGLFDQLETNAAPFYKVKRALYGMKASGRDWYCTL